MPDELTPVVQEVSYFHAADPPIRGVIRALAILGVVIGASSLVLTTVSLLLPEYRRNLSLLSAPLQVSMVGYYLFGMGTHILLLTGSILALKSPPRGRRPLLIYAYGHFCGTLLFMGLSSWATLFTYGSSGAYSMKALGLYIAGVFIRSLGGIGFPLVLAVLLPRAEFRRAFDDRPLELQSSEFASPTPR